MPTAPGASPALSSPSVLASTALYVRLKPQWRSVVGVLALFFVGSLLSGIPTDLTPPSWSAGTPLGNLVAAPWPLKVVGSLFMAGAFYLAFSTLPSKASG